MVLCIGVTSKIGHHHTQISLNCVSAGNDAAYLTGAKHQNTVAKLQQHIKVFAYINNSDTLLLLLIDQIINRVEELISRPLTA